MLMLHVLLCVVIAVGFKLPVYSLQTLLHWKSDFKKGNNPKNRQAHTHTHTQSRLCTVQLGLKGLWIWSQ